MNEPNTYEIETLADFQKVPPERMVDCLKEFADYLEIVRNFEVLSIALGESRGVDGALKGQTFVWIDDGKNDCSIRVKPVPNEKSSATPKGR